MQTTTPRDILSHDDIAATCGDADCATSDAEMTPADEAVVALVAAEIVEADASPYANYPAAERAAQEALDAKRAAGAAAWLAGAPAREAAARSVKAPAGKVVCPCCGRTMSVHSVAGPNGAQIVVKHGWKGQANGATGRGWSGTSWLPKCCPGSFNAVLAA